MAGALYYGMVLANGHLPSWAALPINVLLIMVFCAVIVWRDLPISSIPVIGKYFRKG